MLLTAASDLAASTPTDADAGKGLEDAKKRSDLAKATLKTTAALAAVTFETSSKLETQLEPGNVERYKEYCEIAKRTLCKAAIAIATMNKTIRGVVAAGGPKGLMNHESKKTLKENIKIIFNEHDADKTNQKLVAKHMGAILREAMKNAEVAVERSWGEWISDLVRSSAKKEEAKMA